jgi:malate synthase
MAETRTFEEGVEVNALIPDEFAEILTPEAVSFVAKLSREFGGRVDEILEKRKGFQERIDAGEMTSRTGGWRLRARRTGRC